MKILDFETFDKSAKLTCLLIREKVIKSENFQLSKSKCESVTQIYFDLVATLLRDSEFLRQDN